MPPRKEHFLHNKCVYKTKIDANEDIERYKARLVVCGNEKVFGVDYNLTFAAVMDLATVKLFLILSRQWNVPARHGGVLNAYVKAGGEPVHLHEGVKGMQLNHKELATFGVQSTGEIALLLKKSLYGLKQAGRRWNKILHSRLHENGFN